MKDYYVIAQKDLSPNAAHSSEWPKIIGYSYKDKYFLFLEGKGHGLMGGELPESTAKQLKWRDIFIILNAEWFLDFLDKTHAKDETDFICELTKLIGAPDTITY
ncbi:hypothetical protein [Pseudomonas sp. CC6-YY-74]|uniref:hypothetical protein n=1 Tax=Pseudomonas sp. CC6-YY-74 TaxID=1930532 RepID=UPI0009A168CD|nr:hypothetical protein [Pseudomonas sp. CC6-YY-74]